MFNLLLAYIGPMEGRFAHQSPWPLVGALLVVLTGLVLIFWPLVPRERQSPRAIAAFFLWATAYVLLAYGILQLAAVLLGFLFLAHPGFALALGALCVASVRYARFWITTSRSYPA